MDVRTVSGREIAITRATEADIPALVALLADDELGTRRESGNLAPYLFAFREIDQDDNQFLLMARDEDTRRRDHATHPHSRTGTRRC